MKLFTPSAVYVSGSVCLLCAVSVCAMQLYIPTLNAVAYSELGLLVSPTILKSGVSECHVAPDFTAALPFHSTILLLAVTCLWLCFNPRAVQASAESLSNCPPVSASNIVKRV